MFPKPKGIYFAWPVKPELTALFLDVLFVATWRHIAALLFFNTDFAEQRWPWELNAFDARIMAARLRTAESVSG